MTAEPHGVPTYPVWVGSLKETVKEKDLLRVCSKHGVVANCKIMRDEQGNSKRFGYVNFYNEADAERAAEKLVGFQIQGTQLKTKGPRLLKKQGHFSVAHHRPTTPGATKTNYRPLTDCSFFIQGDKCKKGKNCPYRHSTKALTTLSVCRAWLKRRCTNLHCPLRHPGSKEGGRNTSESSECCECGGRCGVPDCTSTFATSKALAQHIKLAKFPQCRYCRGFFPSEKEYQQHKKLCGARTLSGSTDTASLSSGSGEIELSDPESLTSDEEGCVSPPLAPSPLQTSPKKRGSTASFSGGFGARNPSRAPLHKVYSESAMGNMRVAVDKNLESGFNGLLVYSSGTETATSSDSSVEYLDGSDYFDYDSDDDDAAMSFEYSNAEMARLLSLNEQDMVYESESEEESEGEEEEEEEGGESERLGPHALRPKGWKPTATVSGEDKDSEVVKKKRYRSHKSKGSQGPASDATRVPEPVGVFWDIENCPVPPEKSAFALANKMRREFFEGKREAEFMCVCDITKERKEVTDELHKAQVTLVHVSAVAKNAADDKLRQSLRRFAHTYPPPSTVVLISGDVNFSPELNDLRHIHNITITLVHNEHASEALRVFAHSLISYEKFLEDVGAPREAQKSNLPRIVVVSGLPSHMPRGRVSSRLDQLSDNCGGKVLNVDLHLRTARILFRTPDWAMKAQKRMSGEDVFGSKITVTLEAPSHHHPPSHQHPPPNQGPPFKRLSGPDLSKSFPPQPQQPPKQQHYPQLTPPPPQRNPGPRPMGILPHPPPLHFPPPVHGPPHPHLLPTSPPQPIHRHIPLPHPPHPPPQPPPHPPYAQAVMQPPPRGPPPQGKILIFKVPPVSELELDRLNSHVVQLRLAASIKAEHVILWHSYSELQVLLRVDFYQTALARRDDLVRTMYERGELRPQVAQEFVEGCTRSLVDVCRREQVPWDVTTCGWSEEEEQDRITRSQVIALLRRYPSFWTKWSNFKEKYSQHYSSAISEMAIHIACKGAVQILGNPGKEQTQVIVFYELSPLVRIINQPSSAQAMVQKNVLRLLSSQPEKRVKLLDFVRVYHDTCGPLPVSANGKPLQEIITATPGVILVGGKPSNINVTLMRPGAKMAGAPAQLPRNLTEIAAAFRHLLNQYSSSQLPLRQIQQEYQTFYHKSFRVSDYLPRADAKLRDLLEACEGIKLREVPLSNGKSDTIVFIETESTRAQATTTPAAPPPIPVEAVQKFRQECVEVLRAEQGHRVYLIRFHEAYLKHFGHQMSLSNYGAKKLINLLEAISDTVKVTGEKEERIVELLVKDTKEDCEKRVEALLYKLPKRQVTLDRFMYEYERAYGEQLSHYYGHPKLSSLLESMTDIVVQEGKGAGRCVTLRPAKLFACEMADLLVDHPQGLAINKIVPSYKEKFGRDLLVAQYGFPKLIRALEAIQHTIEIRGTGPTRVVLLKRGRGTGPFAFPSASSPSPSASSPSPSLSSSQLFSDEVVAILMTTHGLKMSLPNLTKMYNQAFRTPDSQHPVSSEEMGEALKRLPNFKLTGSGPTQYVQLVKHPDAQEQQPKEKAPTTQPTAKGGNQQEQESEVQPQTQVEELQGQAPPPAAKKEEKPKVPEPAAAAVESPSKLVKQAKRQLDEKEAKRLSSETHRLLLCHQEHAMTLSELVECFRVGEDPASPSAEELYQCLKKNNSKGGGGKGQNNFQISYIPTSVVDSVIQLNQSDCLWKLSRDLLYLFVYHPTPTFSMPVSDLLAVYAECFGRKFVPAVYAAKKFQQLMGGKHTVKVLKLDQGGARCSLIGSGQHVVLASLLAELLFLRGEQCRRMEDLPLLYQQHFGVPLDLSCLGVLSVTDLLQLPEISQVVQVSNELGMSRPLLTNTTLLAEQLRHLLTIHNGRLPLANLKEIYVAEFGTPKDSKLAGMLDKNLLQIAPHTVNLTGHKWVVWAPTGQPYPPRGGKVSRFELSGPVDGGEKESNVSKLDEAATTDIAANVGEGLATGDGADSRSDGNHKESAKVVVTEGEDKRTQVATSGSPTVPAAKIGGLEVTTPEAPFITDEGPPSGGVTNQTVTGIAAANTLQSQNSLSSAVHGESPKLTRPDPPSDSSNTQQQPKLDEMSIDPSSPYGFLSSALIAELIIHTKELATNDLPTADGTENPDFLTQYGSEFQEDRLKDGSGGELEGKDEPSTPPEKVDYLKKNMTPDEVLHEFRQLKERCGGYLDPEKMDPFLTYFGELSGRELERLESLKAKPSSSTKGAARRKQMMAIRFPSQSPAPPTDPFEEQRKKHMQEMEGIVQNLPVAPDLSNLSDSSDSEGSYPTPFAREEYVKKLLEKGLPKVFLSEEDGQKSSDKEESSFDATRIQPANASLSELSTTAELPKPLLKIGSDVITQLSVTSDPTTSPPPSELPSDWPLLPGTLEYDQLHTVKTNTPS